MTEGQIRDILAQNLEIIEPGLIFIEKEHYLKNIVGATGYIDILAKDQYENYVVIEIKRSQQSSRQAIQELFKYIGLLKQNYAARESEIRCIIVSTHWDELLIPFSELRIDTSLDVKGIKLLINETNESMEAQVIQ